MLEPINLPEVEGGRAATSAELDAALADPGTIIVNDRPNRQVTVMTQTSGVRTIGEETWPWQAPTPLFCLFCRKKMACTEIFEIHIKGVWGPQGPIDEKFGRRGGAKCTVFDASNPADVNVYNASCIAMNGIFGEAYLDPIHPSDPVQHLYFDDVHLSAGYDQQLLFESLALAANFARGDIAAPPQGNFGESEFTIQLDRSSSFSLRR